MKKSLVKKGKAMQKGFLRSKKSLNPDFWNI